MNIKDKSASVNTLTDGEVFYDVKILRLQIFGLEDRSSGVRITVHHEQYGVLFYALAAPNQEIGGIAIYMGLLEALLKRAVVRIKATGYHGEPEVGLISGVTFGTV
ncbi:hypothetical protein BDD26_1564 [Xenorhabdus cabanillasii]|uniref:Uncharacterized protein n=1 Tax=Xenorhabdus cabanillasii TaxID=351673 RepID=A0A3D9UBV5_9GAMM|nr:hypothetical protein [Xenorhabdus cabanillasii]REF26869.1 hypothetical protein BDD26_1564 [Xenorhabdus cabanillasii]